MAIPRTKRTRTKDTVSFRLRPSFMESLSALAEERQEKSPDDLARRLVIDALNGEGTRRQVEEMQEQLTLFRDDLVTAVSYVLQLTAKADAKDARQVAEDLFRNRVPKG